MTQTIKETLSFQIDATKRAALDQIATTMDRDRSHVIREAIDTFIEIAYPVNSGRSTSGTRWAGE